MGKSTTPKAGNGAGTTWAKHTVGGPSGEAGESVAALRKRNGPHDETSAGAHLARKVAATEALAGAMPSNPTKAAESIMPSIPMFTMPERSFMTPHIAPRAMGAASPTTIGAIPGVTSIT